METESNMAEKQIIININTLSTSDWSLVNTSLSILRLEPLYLEREALKNIKEYKIKEYKKKNRQFESNSTSVTILMSNKMEYKK